MANITPYTDQIRNARYGEEVRGSIVGALEAMNDDINNDTASAAAYAGQAASSAQAAANTASGLSDILTDLSALENTVEASETLRGTAESNRVSAENARVVAEQARENQETGYVAQAAAYAQQAAEFATSDYAMRAKSWAIGNAGGVRDDEDTNNAKYWSDMAQYVVTEGGVATFNGRRGNVTPESGDYTSTQIIHGSGTVAASLLSIETSLSDVEEEVDTKMDGTTSTTTVAANSSLDNVTGALILRKIGSIVIANGSISLSSGNLPMGTSSNPTSGQLFGDIPSAYRPKANASMRGLLVGSSVLPTAANVGVSTGGVVYQSTSSTRSALLFSGTWETA